MNKIEQDNGRTQFILYLVILVLLLVIIFMLYVNTKKRYIVDTYETIAYEKEGEVYEDISERVIEKKDVIIQAEEVLRVIRKVEKLNNGSFKIVAYLKNADLLDESIVLQDFVEDIRFSKKVEIESGRVVAMNGDLFPAGERLNLSTYGPGPVDKKPSNLNITILDINFGNETQNTYLYELNFKTDKDVSQLIFPGAEFRFDQYILELEEEIVTLHQ